MNPLFLLIENFYIKLQNGEFDGEDYSLAVALQTLSDQAWERVDDLIDQQTQILQSSLRID